MINSNLKVSCEKGERKTTREMEKKEEKNKKRNDEEK